MKHNNKQSLLQRLLVKLETLEKSVSLDKEDVSSLAEAVSELDQTSGDYEFPESFREKTIRLIKSKATYLGSILLISASSVGNFLNFIFNSYLGRVLNFDDFAMIGLTSGLLSFASIIFGAFSTTANYKSAFIIGQYGDQTGFAFWKFIRKRAFAFSILLTAIWILLTPLLMKIFDAETPSVFFIFGIVILCGLANGADRGFISARLQFGRLAAINLIDPIIRLITAIVLVTVGLKFWTFSGISLAILGTFILGWILITVLAGPKHISPPLDQIKGFPYTFYLASLLTGFSSIAFSSFDLLLANHYLPTNEAGKYTLLSLVGKMVYYLGGLTTPFIVPLLSRIEGANRNSKNMMYLLAGATVLLTFVGFICFGMFGFVSIPILYGRKAYAIVPYVAFFTFGMMCYTVSKVFVNYYLIKKMYSITVITSLLVFVQIFLIAFFHSSAGVMGFVMTLIWCLHLLTSLTYHFLSEKIHTIEQAAKKRFLFLKNYE